MQYTNFEANASGYGCNDLAAECTRSGYPSGDFLPILDTAGVGFGKVCGLQRGRGLPTSRHTFPTSNGQRRLAFPPTTPPSLLEVVDWF